jgi:hypothetical protein
MIRRQIMGVCVVFIVRLHIASDDELHAARKVMIFELFDRQNAAINKDRVNKVGRCSNLASTCKTKN